MPGVTAYKKLDGGPGMGNNTLSRDFSNFERKQKREHLYNRMNEILQNQNMEPYDKFWVLKILSSQVRDGKL